jgi:hypothetical protein
MWIEYQPNPVRTDGVGDCSVRAVSKALGITWEQAYARLTLNGFLMGDIPSSDIVWGSVLRQNGFRRSTVPNTCPDCYTVSDFCRDHPDGTFVIKSEGHVATVVDGDLYDSWPSENQAVIYYWTNREEE